MGIGIEKSFDFFIKNDFKEYAEGEWVAILNKEIISHNMNLEKVVNAVKEKSLPLSKVLITKVRRTAVFL